MTAEHTDSRRTNRMRAISAVMQIVTVVVVLTLLVYSVVTSQNLAESRQEQALAAQTRNRELLQSLDEIVRDIRAAQVNQRHAFRKLAARNEELHGSDPEAAPRFDPLPPPRQTPPQRTSGAQRDDSGANQRRATDDDRQSRRDPPQASPTPTPVCVPVIRVCVDRRGLAP